MSDLKHDLVEVLCSFGFEPNANPWDSTFFGEFYEKIKTIGFTEKQEQKGIQFKVEIDARTPAIPRASADVLETRMLFRNSNTNSAIILAPNFISFHKLAPYASWETFRKESIEPGLRIYQELGLGLHRLLQTQVLYLNKYEFERGVGLSEKFKFIPEVDKMGIGKEKSLRFQSQYDFDPNLIMQIKLNANSLSNGRKDVVLECSCIAMNNEDSSDYFSLAELAHKKNNEVFNLIAD